MTDLTYDIALLNHYIGVTVMGIGVGGVFAMALRIGFAMYIWRAVRRLERSIPK
jgi:hypothetical protein